jgi:ABC-2 type transport system permease protein
LETTAIFKRECLEYFKTMLGYVFIAAFLFLSGVSFAVANILPLDANFNATLSNCIYVFMITSPLLTMRLLSEEKRTKRDQLLLTSGLSAASIVLGKFLAALCVFAVACALTFVYPLILTAFGAPPVTLPILNGYLGFFLIGATFLSVGVFVSALTENQLTAAIGAYGCLLLFLTLDLLIPRARVGRLSATLQWFSLFRRFSPYQFGSFSVSSTVYYVVFSAAFLALSVLAWARSRSKLRRGPIAVSAFAVLAAAVLLTLLAERLEDRLGLHWDLTRNRVYSITDATRSVLETLDEDLIVYTVYPAGERDVTIGELLRRYEMASRRVEVRNIDPVRAPLFTRQFERDGRPVENNSIIVARAGGDKDYRVIRPQNLYEWQLRGDRLFATGLVAEQRVTSSILSLTGGRQPRIGFAEGHGEKRFSDLYYLAGLLENDGYLVQSYNLVYNDVKLEEGDLLLFVAPVRDLTDEEAGVLEDFFGRGGRAAFYIDIFAPDMPNFARVLRPFGLALTPQLIVEDDAERFLNDTVILSPLIEAHPATQMLRESGTAAVMPRCRGVVVSAVANGVENAPLYSSSPRSFGKTDPLSASLEKEEADVDGPFTLAAAAENSENGSRVLLFGSADFITSLQAVRFAGNLAAFIDGVTWAAGRSASVAIQPKSLVNPPLQIASASDAGLLVALVAGLLPLTVLAAGFVVWRRRNAL